jgi:cobalamin biosynthesis protein CobT
VHAPPVHVVETDEEEDEGEEADEEEDEDEEAYEKEDEEANEDEDEEANEEEDAEEEEDKNGFVQHLEPRTCVPSWISVVPSSYEERQKKSPPFTCRTSNRPDHEPRGSIRYFGLLGAH